MHLSRQRLRRFFGSHADGFSAAYIHESRRSLSPVAKLQSAFAQSTARDHRDSVGGAAVDLNKSDETLAVFAARVIDAEFLQPEHREPHCKGLPRPRLSLGLLR